MEKKKRRRPASAVPAGGGPGGRNETDRRLSRLVTPFLTTKSGSRMPNWIALTRLTGADEYGKRSIVAMMGKRSGCCCCRRRLASSSSSLLLLYALSRHKAFLARERACVRRARATAERNGQARGAHRKTERCLVFLFFFFFCLALPSSSALGGGSESSAPLTMPTKKKVDAPAGGEKRCLSFPSSLRRGKRAWPVPSCSRSLLPERFPALPERDGGSEGSFVSRKQKEENVSITLSPFFSLCRRSLLL